jgi:hypothetical protein
MIRRTRTIKMIRTTIRMIRTTIRTTRTTRTTPSLHFRVRRTRRTRRTRTIPSLRHPRPAESAIYAARLGGGFHRRRWRGGRGGAVELEG